MLGEVVLGKVFAVGIPVDTEDTAVELPLEAVVGLPVESVPGINDVQTLQQMSIMQTSSSSRCSHPSLTFLQHGYDVGASVEASARASARLLKVALSARAVEGAAVFLIVGALEKGLLVGIVGFDVLVGVGTGVGSISSAKPFSAVGAGVVPEVITPKVGGCVG